MGKALESPYEETSKDRDTHFAPMPAQATRTKTACPLIIEGAKHLAKHHMGRHTLLESLA